MRHENRKPLVKESLTPEEIIGDDMSFVESHYRATRNCVTTEEHDKAVKRIDLSLHEIDKVADAYKRLRDKGYYVRGTDNNGNIVFGQAKMSDLQDMVQHKYPLKCDNCDCPEGKCYGYNHEQIEYFKKLARERVPISQWPSKIFNF